MKSSWSPHARYRLYTTGADYRSGLFDTKEGVENFEHEVCRRFNVAAAVCVPMARVGLYLVVREMIRPGQKVILSPLTIVDVVMARVSREGFAILEGQDSWLVRLLVGWEWEKIGTPPVDTHIVLPGGSFRKSSIASKPFRVGRFIPAGFRRAVMP